MGHSKIKEFEDVFAFFSSMKDNLKSSLEKQWNAEQLQREQIAKDTGSRFKDAFNGYSRKYRFDERNGA